MSTIRAIRGLETRIRRRRAALRTATLPDTALWGILASRTPILIVHTTLEEKREILFSRACCRRITDQRSLHNVLSTYIAHPFHGMHSLSLRILLIQPPQRLFSKSFRSCYFSSLAGSFFDDQSSDRCNGTGNTKCKQCCLALTSCGGQNRVVIPVLALRRPLACLRIAVACRLGLRHDRCALLRIRPAYL